MIDPSFFILERNKFHRLKSLFQPNDWAKVLVFFSSLLIFLLLSLAVFFFSLSSFKFLGYYQQSSQPIISYTLAVTFIFASILVFISSITTSLGILFQKDDNGLVFSLPIAVETVFESRLVDVILFSSWPLFIFALPMVLGFSLAFKLTIWPTFLFLAGLLFLALLVSLLGSIFSLLITKLWGNLKNKFLAIGLLITVPIFAWGLITLILPSPLVANLESLSIEEIGQLVNRQALMNQYLPTTWLLKLIQSWETNLQLSLNNFIYLADSLIAVLILVYLLRNKFYMSTVNKAAEGRFIAAPWDTVRKKTRPFPYFLSGRMGALTEKDWLVVLRSPAQFGQIAFLIFLELIYFLIISRIPLSRLAQLFPNWYQGPFLILNFSFISYLACVIGIRFLFPLISLEGQSSWIIWSAPVARMKIFWQKLISSAIIIFIWLQISSLFSVKILGLSFVSQWPFFLINIPLSLTITTITLGIGAIKPNFWEKNPEKLSTSPGGIIATVICLVYITVLSFVLLIGKKGIFLPGINQFFIWIISLSLSLPIIFEVSRRINKYEI